MAPDTSTPGLADFLAAHAPLLARLHAEAGAARWEVSHDEFATALQRSAAHRLSGSPLGDEALGKYLGTLHLADLVLACALRRGSAAAWEEFVATYRPVLYAAARAIVGSGGEARARELADSLYAELYGLNRSGSQGRPLLDYFHGRSKLSTWLRSVLAQRYVDALRAGRRIDPLEEEALHPTGSVARTADTGFGKGAPDADPDRTRLLPRLRQAVAAALASTTPADRLLLSLYYVQGMKLDRIARLHAVHEATISRSLDRIRKDLRTSVEHSLISGRAAENGDSAQPGLSAAEVELCFSYATEDWAFDLGGALSSAGDDRKG